MVQLGGLALDSPCQVPLSLRLVSLFYLLKSSVVWKIKNTCLICSGRRSFGTQNVALSLKIEQDNKDVKGVIKISQVFFIFNTRELSVNS